jgi:hypothetical protein
METAILLLTERILDLKEQLKRAESKLRISSDKHKLFLQKARDNIVMWIDECNDARLVLQNHSAVAGEEKKLPSDKSIIVTGKCANCGVEYHIHKINSYCNCESRLAWDEAIGRCTQCGRLIK